MNNKNYNYPTGEIILPSFIDNEGIFEVTLVDKMWGKQCNLICIFETEDKSRFCTTAWRRGKPGREIYTPKRSEIDFKEVSRGTKWACKFTLSKNKKYYDWLEAILIE